MVGDAGAGGDRRDGPEAAAGRQRSRFLLYRASIEGGPDLFLKVYERDSRDADALYRAYRTVQLRDPTEGLPAALWRWRWATRRWCC